MPVFSSCDDSVISLWKNVYEPSRGLLHDKTIEESLWRRTQNFNNRFESGWKTKNDMRRKTLHYKHKYDLLYSEVGRPYIALVDSYININITLPSDELAQYLSMIRTNFVNGGWQANYSDQTKQIYTRGNIKAVS